MPEPHEMTRSRERAEDSSHDSRNCVSARCSPWAAPPWELATARAATGPKQGESSIHKDCCGQNLYLGLLSFCPCSAGALATVDLSLLSLTDLPPFHLLGLNPPSFSLAPCCPLSGFGVHRDLATLSGPDSWSVYKR